MNPFLILSSASELVHLVSTILPESKPLDDYDKMLEMIHYLEDNISQKITIRIWQPQFLSVVQDAVVFFLNIFIHLLWLI